MGHFWSQPQIDAFNEELQTRFSRSNSQGKKVLDIGCGFGLYSIFFGLSGASHITGVDLDSGLIGVFNKLLADMPSISNVIAKCGDALKLDVQDSAFDVVLCLNSISHFRDTRTFILEMRRVLKAGGVLYISDDNNSLSLVRTLYNNIRWWRQREMRKRQRESVIRDAYPSLDNVTLAKLVSKTTGMRRDEILRAVQEFLTTGKVTLKPAYKRGNPILEDVIEIEHNPLRLRKYLETEFGFKARLIRHFVSRYPTFPQERPPTSFQRVVRLVWRALSYTYPFSLILVPHFEMIAICRK